MDKQKIINDFIDFVEGRMPFDEFEHNYKTNPDYFMILEDIMPGEKYRCMWKHTVNEHMRLYEWSTVTGKLVVHRSVTFFLEYYGVAIEPTQAYQENAQFLVDIQPNYVNIEDENFLNTIIAMAPTELTKAQKKKWLKEKIKSLFKYDNKLPRWIQDPEWPIVNGEPLTFKGQTKERKDDERVFYTFYQPETGEEMVVVQFY